MKVLQTWAFEEIANDIMDVVKPSIRKTIKEQIKRQRRHGYIGVAALADYYDRVECAADNGEHEIEISPFETFSCNPEFVYFDESYFEEVEL
jgi:hypothetical protein